MSFEVRGKHFIADEKKSFLLSGEIHYFRIKRELWDLHLQYAKECGLTTVSTYVPWAWHEEEEGNFDFEGKSVAEKDLVGWIDCCEKYGLKCILKPGPFILAEWRGAGIPDWFLDQYADETKMKTRAGLNVASDGLNLFNPVYLEKVGKWYDQIMPLVAKRQTSNGGPVIMMQVCNEIGVFSWLAHQADYGGKVKMQFIQFVKEQFDDIQLLNQLWDTHYVDFEAIELPPDGNMPYQSKADRARDHFWHDFWRRYYADYLRMLSQWVRDRGVTVPLYHNLPGWIYGNGFEFPVNITMYEDLFGSKSEILFGVDHIPEFQSYRNLHDDRIINDITRAMQGDKPLFAAEFQCGSREYHVETNPREMELFYKASIANGLTGWNYYMFSQGKNPPAKGYSGDTFYWFNPLTPDATKTAAWNLVHKLNRIVKTCEDVIVESTRKSEVCVLFYPPYYATELERPIGQATDIIFNPSAIRRPAYFDGLLKALQILNIDYDMADLKQVTQVEMQHYKQIWLFSADEMDAEPQQKLSIYLQNGGDLVIFPQLPDRDLAQQSCTLLRDTIGISTVETESTDSALIDVYNLKDIKCANPQIIFPNGAPEGSTVLARTLKGSICGFEKNIGKGKIRFLGAWIGFDTEGHRPVYESILKKSNAKLGSVSTSNYHLLARQRFTDDGMALLFLGNYYNESHQSTASYTHPQTGEAISIPYNGSAIVWPAMYALLSPIAMNLIEGLYLLHTTSDLLNLKIDSENIELQLVGDRDLKGELVFEGIRCQNIKRASLNGIELAIQYISNRVVLSYEHIHLNEMHLVVYL